MSPLFFQLPRIGNPAAKQCNPCPSHAICREKSRNDKQSVRRGLEITSNWWSACVLTAVGRPAHAVHGPRVLRERGQALCRQAARAVAVSVLCKRAVENQEERWMTMRGLYFVARRIRGGRLAEDRRHAPDLDRVVCATREAVRGRCAASQEGGGGLQEGARAEGGGTHRHRL
jgi:hypothetical protein